MFISMEKKIPSFFQWLDEKREKRKTCLSPTPREVNSNEKESKKENTEPFRR